MALLNHLRFYLPQLFPSLHRMLFLDDDVIVQKDLSALFSLDMNGMLIIHYGSWGHYRQAYWHSTGLHMPSIRHGTSWGSVTTHIWT
ncbi:hypothetical protein CLOM_g11548 [Closterium sp. NIES-68]|nr:hypothetical protein CLOM_g11548 [Closterium sp. NIES-68]